MPAARLAVIGMSYRIAGGDFDSAGGATRQLKEQLVKIGVGAAVIRRVMIASYEAEMNVVIHAKTGTLWARLDGGALDLEVADEGPGIPDVELALREGWSTASDKAREMGFGAGMGLPNIRRNSDLFEIETRVGRGTRIRSRIILSGVEQRPQDARDGIPESPSVAADRCHQCLRCIFSCPTAALRVGDRGPHILERLCIGCTACIGECTAGVFGIDVHDGREGPELSVPENSLLILPRGFLTGFGVEGTPGRVLSALGAMGFTDVRFLDEWEAALLAEARRSAFGGSAPSPLIPPVCPAVVALVESRFPSLMANLGPWLSPVEAAAEESPLRPVVLVPSCPAQHALARAASLTERVTALSPARLAAAVRPLLRESAGAATDAGLATPFAGGGEPEQHLTVLTVSGVRHVLRMLSAAEAGALSATAILNLSLCEAGCSGSPLLNADPYLSTQRWQAVAGSTGGPAAGAGRAAAGPTPAPVTSALSNDAMAVSRRHPYMQRPGMRLDPDMGEAIRKLAAIDAQERSLPGRNCGACGAPTCVAFAEDVIMGRAVEGRCPHREEKP